MHGRRRYRLVPTPEPGQNPPTIDPCLWLVHYYRQADPEHQIPAQSIRPPVHEQQLMTERGMLQQQGQLLQLQHKEFMLRDRDNWPTINLPGSSATSYPQQAMGYPGNVMAHMSRSQQTAYMQNPQAAMGPSSKRPRHSSAGHNPMSSTAIPMLGTGQDSNHDDEDSLLGADYMDLLSPQDISRERYKQHHEWLEEILSSPYDTNQIQPGDLGLGRKGELESLTKDFFKAHTHTDIKIGEERALRNQVTPDDYQAQRIIADDIPTVRVGRLEPGKSDDFRKRAAQRMENLQTEMEDLRQQHAKRMERITRGRSWKDLNHRVRESTMDMMNAAAIDRNAANSKEVDSMIEKAERTVNKRVRPLRLVECTEKGGLEENIRRNATRDSDEEAEASKTAGAGSFEPGVSEYSSRNSTASLQPLAPDVNQRVMEPPASRAQSSHVQPTKSPPEIDKSAPEDWIMVDKDAESHEQSVDQSVFENITSDSEMQLDGKADDIPLNEDPVAADGGLNFEDTHFGNAIDFGDLDTPGDLDEAGDMMSSYAQEIESMGAKEQQELSLGAQPSQEAPSSALQRAEGGEVSGSS